MNIKTLKLRLLKVDKTQKDLLFEVRKRGYPKLSQPAISAYINGIVATPQAEAVMKIIDDILREWEGK